MDIILATDERRIPGTCGVCGIKDPADVCKDCSAIDWSKRIKFKCFTCGDAIPGTMAWFRMHGNSCVNCNRRATLSATQRARLLAYGTD